MSDPGKKKLDQLRQSLRSIDDDIIDRVVERMAVVREIGIVKRDYGMKILDEGREAKNIAASCLRAGDHLPKPMVEDLSELLAKWARNFQASLQSKS